MRNHNTITSNSNAGSNIGSNIRSVTIKRHIVGQGLTEYLIIIMVVVIAGVSAASFFGDSVKASFLSIGAELTGGEAIDAEEETRTSFDKARRDTNTQTTLRNYRD